jgi:hypothetical protein
MFRERIEGLSCEIYRIKFFLKGSLTRDFQPLVQVSVSHGPKYPIGAISNCYENSQIYSNVKVIHALVSTTPADNEKNFETKFFHIC